VSLIADVVLLMVDYRFNVLPNALIGARDGLLSVETELNNHCFCQVCLSLSCLFRLDAACARNAHLIRVFGRCSSVEWRLTIPTMQQQSQ